MAPPAVPARSCSRAGIVRPSMSIETFLQRLRVELPARHQGHLVGTESQEGAGHLVGGESLARGSITTSRTSRICSSARRGPRWNGTRSPRSDSPLRTGLPLRRSSSSSSTCSTPTLASTTPTCSSFWTRTWAASPGGGEGRAWARSIRSLSSRFEAAVTKIFEQGIESNAFSGAVPAPMLTRAVIGMVDETRRWWRPKDGRSIEELARFFSTILLDGIRPRGAMASGKGGDG
jgi:hypothetical protein